MLYSFINWQYCVQCCNNISPQTARYDNQIQSNHSTLQVKTCQWSYEGRKLIFSLMPSFYLFLNLKLCRGNQSKIKILYNNIYKKVLHNCLILVSQGRIQYSKVTAFLQRDHGVTNMYLSVMTTSNKAISLSESHLIYTRKPGSAKFNVR